MKADFAAFPETHKEDWLKAQQRILVYLRLLKVPPVESLEIALESMKRAKSFAVAGQHPLKKSMRALHEVLREHESVGKEGFLFSDLPEPVRMPLLAPLARKSCERIPSHPPIDRGFMIPERNRLNSH